MWALSFLISSYFLQWDEKGPFLPQGSFTLFSTTCTPAVVGWCRLQATREKTETRVSGFSALKRESAASDESFSRREVPVHVHRNANA